MQAYMGTTEGELQGARMSTPALEISGLQAWYEESHILHGVDMRVGQGEVVTLLGRNGAGRTTTLRAILGLTGSRKGSVRIHGTEAIDLPTTRSPTWAWATAPRNAASSQACPARKTCCCPGGRFARRRHVADRDLRHVPQPAGTQAFRPACRAANNDAGGGAHPAHRRQPAAAGRDLRRSGAGHRAGPGPHDHGAEAARLPS